MRAFFVLLLLATIFLTSCDAQPEVIELQHDASSSLHHQGTSHRFLRDVETIDAANDLDDEKRLSAAVKKVTTKFEDMLIHLGILNKYETWYKRGVTPDSIFKRNDVS
ncbi:Putative RxLR effector, partial [Phytophthora palmivora]